MLQIVCLVAASFAIVVVLIGYSDEEVGSGYGYVLDEERNEKIAAEYLLGVAGLAAIYHTVIASWMFKCPLSFEDCISLEDCMVGLRIVVSDYKLCDKSQLPHTQWQTTHFTIN